MSASAGPSHVVLDRLWAPVEPGWMEAPWPFLRRVAMRNVVDPQLLEANIRSRRTTQDGSAVAEAIHELTGVPPTNWVEGHAYAATGIAAVGSAFAKQSRGRTGCAKCNPLAESPVAQYDHVRENVCLRHAVWIGPAARANQQEPVDQATLSAEARYRDLVTTGHVDADLWNVVWRAVRDSAFLCGDGLMSADLDGARHKPGFAPGVDDVRLLYPVIVQVLETVTQPDLVEILRQPGRQNERRRQALYEALDWLEGERWVVVEKIESHFRFEGIGG